MKRIVFLVLLTLTLSRQASAIFYQSNEGYSNALSRLHNDAIVFSLESPSLQQIHMLDTKTASLKSLTSSKDRVAYHPVWSPDGLRIAFDSASDKDGSGIFVVNADGTQQKRLTKENVDAERPVWSPNGIYIAMNCAVFDPSVSQSVSQICTVNSDGTNFKVLTTVPNNRFPAWSPDGKKIAYVWCTEPGCDLYLMNADGSARTQLTTSNTPKFMPSWSPDGKHIVFSSGDNPRSDIFMITLDGGAFTNLTKDLSTRNDWPVWSPDGHFLAFHADYDLGLIKFDADKTETVEWFGPGGGFYDYAWSPDSTRLAFVSHGLDPEKSGIYVVPIACMFVATGCSEKDIVKLNVSSSWARDLNWAYVSAAWN